MKIYVLPSGTVLPVDEAVRLTPEERVRREIIEVELDPKSPQAMKIYILPCGTVLSVDEATRLTPEERARREIMEVELDPK